MIDSDTRQEVVNTLVYLKSLLDRLLLRGLSSVDESELQLLEQAKILFSSQDATYLADCLKQLSEAIHQQSDAAIACLKLQTALFLFERLFTQQVCLADIVESDDEQGFGVDI